MDEEQRAQKALYLLQARDRRIALLEKRVAELEDAATNLHELTLRNSSRASVLELSCSDSTCGKGGGGNYNGGAADLDDLDDVNSSIRGDGTREQGHRVSVPCLHLSKSSGSASDVFSTAVDFVMEKRKCFASNTSFEEEVTERGESGCLDENSRSEVKVGGSGDEEQQLLHSSGRGKKKRKKKDCCVGMGRSEEKVRGVSWNRHHQRPSLPRLTCSVPWIRAKHSFRKKLRGYEPKTGKRTKKDYRDGRLPFAAFQ